jgi:hypothetical protein
MRAVDDGQSAPPRSARGFGRAPFLLASLVAGVLLLIVADPAGGGVVDQRARAAPHLIFGIYPGGSAGTVRGGVRATPDDLARQVAALDQLRAPGRPFVLHLYAAYSGPGSRSAAEQVGSEIGQYTAAGFEIELVVTYRPADGNPARDVPGYVAFVRDAVRTLGSTPRFVALQVTNEANIRTAPEAADGYYAGAGNALIRGVIAAKAEARRNGLDRLAVGFNWAYSLDRVERSFWRRLGRGGRAFRRALDWVGIDVFPETWGPRSSGRDLPSATTKTMRQALATLRNRYMGLAHIPPGVALHVSENGFPTGPRRTEATQSAVMQAAVTAVNAYRATYHITDYRWFDLRDADSSSASFENRYGLLNDDYTPKAAFNVYRRLIATLGS